MIRGSNLSTDVGVRIDERDMVYVSEELAEKYARSLVTIGDLIFTCWGTVGQIGLIDGRTSSFGRYLISNKQMKISPDPERVDPAFLYYYLSQPDMVSWVQGQAIGSSVPGFNLGQLKSLKVRLPLLSTQRAIAEVLGALDDKIAVNCRSTVAAAELITALYRKAVSIEPLRTVPLFEFFEVDFGSAFKGEYFTTQGVGRPLLRIRDIKSFNPQVWTTEARVDETIVQPGDVVLGMDAEFRPTLWVGEPGLLNQRVCRVRGRETESAFALESLRNPLMAVEREKTGTTVIHLNKRDMERISIVVPKSEELGAFELRANPLAKLQVALSQENRALASARDELLPLLMSGRLRVKDAEQIVEKIA